MNQYLFCCNHCHLYYNITYYLTVIYVVITAKLLQLEISSFVLAYVYRSSKGYMGQLMRLHCVVPEGPIVQMNAKLRPGPDVAPFFLPSSEGVITLPHDGWWLLRFPYPYHSLLLMKQNVTL